MYVCFQGTVDICSSKNEKEERKGLINKTALSFEDRFNATGKEATALSTHGVPYSCE